MADIFAVPTTHVQAPAVSLEPNEFEKAVFVGLLESVRRSARGGAIITISVEREHVNAALKLWDSNIPLSFNVEPWQPYVDGFYDAEQ